MTCGCSTVRAAIPHTSGSSQWGGGGAFQRKQVRREQRLDEEAGDGGEFRGEVGDDLGDRVVGNR
jgi:hypothetical protein